MQNEYRDLNTFREGQHIDISGIPDMQNLRVERISDTGVAVTGGTLTPHTVISGRSPARLHIEKEKVAVINGLSADIVIVDEIPDVSHAEKMKNIKTPDNNGTFTIKQLAEANDIPQPYAYNWVKENCVEAGVADRVEGQRGKSAVLYRVKS